MTRTIFYDKGKLEIHKDFIIKHRVVNYEVVISYIILISDQYFYKDFMNASDRDFTVKYSDIFKPLYNNSNVTKHQIEYIDAPVLYEMKNKYDEKKYILGTNSTYLEELNYNVRSGFKDIVPHIVPRYFVIGDIQ